ncbi:MAG: M56 family metallopeptidase [Pseudomonadota bacterium]
MNEVLQTIALANLALLASFAAAWLIETALKQTPLRTAYTLRLYLAIAALASTALPLLLSPIKTALTAAIDLNVTDIVVSQYLKGNLGISATHLTDAIDAKNSFIQNITGGSTTLSVALLSAFAVGAVLRAAYIALNWVRVRRIIDTGSRIRRTRRVDVFVSNRIQVPFSTRGLYRYSIVVPSSVMADRQAAAMVLSHEAQHIRQGDVDWEILLSLVSPLFIINPAFYFLAARIRRFREYSCDTNMLSRSHINAKAYCLLLLRVAANASRARRGDAPGELATSVPFIGRELIWHRPTQLDLRRRVIAISELSKTRGASRSRLLNLVPAVLLTAVMALTVVVLAKPSDWSHDRIMLSTVVNLERLDRINTFGVEPLR